MRIVQPSLQGRLLYSLAVLIGLGSSSALRAEDAVEPKEGISFHRDVRPILQQHCQGCHQPAKPQGQYVATSYADLLKAGKSKKVAVVPGHPEKSELITQIAIDKEGMAEMPRGKPPLSKEKIALITKWIKTGAKDDTPVSDRVVVDADHPPTYVSPPVVTEVAYSPDGKWLAVSGHHEVLLHKADGSGLMSRLVGVSERVQSLAFSPNSKRLAVVGGSPCRFGEVQIWDPDTSKLKLSVTVGHDTLYGVSWSHDGANVAFGCADNTLRAIDARNGEQILFQGAHNDWVLDTTFSKDSTYLVSVSRDMSMKLTHVETQRFIDNVTSITPGVLKGGLMAVARNPFENDQKVKNKEKGTDKTEKWYDELIVAGSDGVPRLYKMHRTKKRRIGDDDNKIRQYEKMPGRIFAVAFSPDGNHFVAGSSHQGKGELKVYQTKDGKVVSKTTELGPVYSVAYRPDGKEVAVGGFDGNIYLVDPMTAKVRKKFIPVPLEPVSISR